MEQSPGIAMDSLLKIVNEREDLFFQLLSFVNNNIQCSSNDFDNTTLFNKFLPLKTHHNSLQLQQLAFIQSLNDLWEEQRVMNSAPKDILHLSSRIYQRLETSLTGVRKSIFDKEGRSARQLIRFKSTLHKILKKQPFLISDYAQSVVHYTQSKFNRQLSKIQKYIEKVSQGDTVCLRELFLKGSDVDASSPQQKQKKIFSRMKRTQLNLKVEGHSQKIQGQKKPTRRVLKSTHKKRQKLQSTRHKPKEQSQSEQQKPNRQQTAKKLYKFYEYLQLNKKQFLEDYIYKEQQKQQKKSQLLIKLQQRNRAVKSQINNYVKKLPKKINPVSVINMPLAYLSKSSGDQHSQSVSKPAEKTRFVISKRRGSFHFQTSSAGQKQSDNEEKMHLSMTKKLTPRNTSQGKSRAVKGHEKSRKLVVIQEQKVFDNQLIPEAKVNESHFHQLPQHLRKDRRNDLRSKRRNNPSPLQNANFPQHFRYNP